MSQDFFHFQELFNNKKIQMVNESLNKIIQNFQFFVIQHINLLNLEKEKQKINERKNNSKIIVIDQFDEPYDQYLIMIFDQTIVIISKSNYDFLITFSSQHEDSTIFTLSDKTSSNLPSEIQLKLNKYDKSIQKDYLMTIEKFSENLSIKSLNKANIKKLWELIKPALSSYFINKSYSKLQEERKFIYDNKKQEIQLNEKNYIALQNLGQSNTSNVQLIFHCDTEQLFALKRYTDFSEEKLFLREFKNFQKNLRHPNLPIFYGKAKIEQVDCLIIEYIRGKSLYKINEIELTETDKRNIIIQLMLTFEFLRSKKLIYRDLKPNNLIFDDKRNIILIDFDRMIGVDEQENIEIRTKNFNNIYMAPELLNNNLSKYTFEEDVFSIGLLIYFIITQKNPIKGRIDKSNNNNFKFNNMPSLYRKLCEECSESDPDKRPKITKLIDYFFNIFIFNNSKSDESSCINETKFYPDWKCNTYHFLAQFINKYDQKTKDRYCYEANNIHLFYQFELGLKYYPVDYFHENISMFIKCLSSISDENKTKSQLYLGIVYLKGNYISQDINKSIHYLTLASNQNNPDAQFFLGKIYYEDKYIPRNINKSIHYFLLSANQNDPYAQYYLGLIYYEGECISRDINKSIHYFKLASDQNNSDAQYYLGLIYYKGEYISRDINKSIHYFTLASDQNNSDAQYYLGLIYYKGEYISRDINKSIYYLSLASEQNNLFAQFILGYIYFEGEYILRDIEKSIQYFSLSANQNNPDAQYFLGRIFYEEQYNFQDIKKSIRYLSLSASQNHESAQFLLGKIYYEGKYISQDMEKSIHYLSLSANQNNSNAQFLLGRIFKYSSRNINTSIHYLLLSANQNNPDAQFYLGMIYYEGKNIPRDINKSIHYLSLSANQNHENAMYFLGIIYYENEYIPRDINKSIHYLSLSANQNNSNAQLLLGNIYLTGEFTALNINKSLYYLSQAANQNNPIALNNLAFFYLKGKYVSRDIKKAILYFTLSANQNFSPAQYNLGIIYLNGKFVKKDAIKGIDFLMQSSKNINKLAHFLVGYAYHEGKYIEQDILKAIMYYKEASNVNDSYAKNNLGIIYKNGFSGKISPNIQLSIEYFQESIRLNRTSISLYNLAHIYIYNFDKKELLDEAIELLMLSISNDKTISASYFLLTLALIKKFQFKIENITQFLKDKTKKLDQLHHQINKVINEEELYDEKKYMIKYEYYRNIDFLYNFGRQYFESKFLNKQRASENKIILTQYNITKDFYEGFNNA